MGQSGFTDSRLALFLMCGLLCGDWAGAHAAPPSPPTVPRAGHADLRALSGEIDPGPTPLFLSGFPDEVRLGIAKDLQLGQVQEQALQTQAQEFALHTLSGPAVTMADLMAPQPGGSNALLSLFAALVTSEQSEEPWSRVLRFQLYERADEDLMLMRQTLLAQPATPARDRALMELEPQRMLSHRRRRLLWAQILKDPASALLPAALAQVATDALRAERSDLALRAKEEQLRRTPSASAADWMELAVLYYQSGDLALGDAARQRASGTPGPLELVEGAREGARALAEHRQGTDLESRLARGAAQIKLGRFRAARSEYEAARTLAPGDARPSLALTELFLLQPTDDFSGHPDGMTLERLKQALALLQPEAPLAHQDAAFFELAVGLETSTVLALVSRPAGSKAPDVQQISVLVGHLDALQHLSEKLQPLDGEEGRAAVVRYGVQVGRLMLGGNPVDNEAQLAGCAAPTLALRTQHPASLSAAHVGLACATVASRAADALQALQLPLPRTADPQQAGRLAVHRLSALLAFIARFQLAQELDSALPYALELTPQNGVDPAARDALVGDAALLRGILRSDRKGWADAATRYQAALQGSLSPAERMRVTLNLAFALHRQKKDQDAADRWAEATRADPAGVQEATFLQLVSGKTPLAELRTRLDGMTALQDSDSMGELWLAWRCALAERAHDGKAASATAQALLELRQKHGRAPDAPLAGTLGIVRRRLPLLSVDWHLSIATAPAVLHFQPRVELTESLYFVPAAPLRLAQVEKLARRARR